MWSTPPVDGDFAQTMSLRGYSIYSRWLYVFKTEQFKCLWSLLLLNRRAVCNGLQNTFLPSFREATSQICVKHMLELIFTYARY